MNSTWRKTSQFLAPAQPNNLPEDGYVLYPSFPVGSGQIGLGWETLAKELAKHSRVVIDGFSGVFWDHLCAQLNHALLALGVRTVWINVEQALRSAGEVEALVAPFLGGDDPLFGTRFTGQLADFFDPEKLRALQPDPEAQLNILHGCGAALANWQGLLVYVDVPKNEIQFRARSGSVRNLGAPGPSSPKEMYKRFYFVDWVALNGHKSGLLPRLDFIVDEQRPDEPAWAAGALLRQSLERMAQNYFRARPWFEPGPWGGSWILRHIRGVSPDVPNYAWSFELISPENGLALESDGRLLEVSFDCLMFQEQRRVLGAGADRFGYAFPIRFDFLDTFDGGNLSIQVHPSPEFVRRHFNESFTQDETYYIMDCKPGAHVYLGFQDGVDPQEFRLELERSHSRAAPMDIDRYVQKVPSHKHDLLLIPHGTIHGSGRDNLVLEISATPYIFTFKMYDWMRMDLDGKPRPLNIARAFENLHFERQGEKARRELISRPRRLTSGPGWQVVHQPTHPVQFYDVHRLEFNEAISVETMGSPHVLMVVEGDYVILETRNGMRQRFNYAETFVVPAAAESYRLLSPSRASVKVIKAFLKPEALQA